MEFDGKIASFKVFDQKGDLSDFRSCSAINVFYSLLQQDSNGPYIDKEVEGDSFMLNDMSNKVVGNQVDELCVLFKV